MPKIWETDYAELYGSMRECAGEGGYVGGVIFESRERSKRSILDKTGGGGKCGNYIKMREIFGSCDFAEVCGEKCSLCNSLPPLVHVTQSARNPQR